MCICNTECTEDTENKLDELLGLAIAGGPFLIKT